MSAPKPGRDVPDEMVALVADLFGRWYGQDLDFADEARTLLAAVLPAHEAMVRAKVAEEIEAAIPEQLHGALELHAAAGQRMAAKIARGTS